MKRPDYTHNDPKGWGGDPTRGAAMGRVERHKPGFVGTLIVHPVSLDQGYDVLGTYWGEGTPLFWVADGEGEVEFFLRAAFISGAVREAKERYLATDVLTLAEAEDKGIFDAPEAYEKAEDIPGWEEFYRDYFEAAAWTASSFDEEGEPPRRVGGHELREKSDPGDLQSVRQVLEEFWMRFGPRLGAARAGQAGHDLLFQCTGAGVGFKDREGLYGEELLREMLEFSDRHRCEGVCIEFDEDEEIVSVEYL